MVLQEFWSRRKMASQKISTLPPAVTPLDGSELVEIVQAGLNKKATASSLKQAPLYQLTTPGAPGTLVDFALPGVGDYVYDVNTVNGDIEIDGVVAQRDGQRVTFCNSGPNRLKLGINVGSAGNQLRANGADPFVMLQNDCLTIQYCQSVLRWFVP
jgi:hypothetical protein